MLGIAAYDSEDEGEAAAPAPGPPPSSASGAAAAVPAADAGPPAAKRPRLDSGPKPPGQVGAGAGQGGAGGEAAQPPKQSPKAAQASAVAGKKQRLPPNRLKEVRQDIRNAKSATAVVQVVRRHIASTWDSRWGAEALQQIAKRSTARTRREWTLDTGVKDLAKRLSDEAASALRQEGRKDGDVETLLLSLEALRRMGMQEAQAQKEILERIIGWMAADGWKHPVKSLARLFWLGATLKLKGGSADFSSQGQMTSELRKRATDLDGPDLGLVMAAMRNEGSKDGALLEKVVLRLKAEGVHVGLSATDLVEMAEGLSELGVTDEAALRPLGQEALRRRGELTPDESHRIHTAYQTMKLPLPKVWMEPGAATKKDGAQIVTTQAFVPQEGHKKWRRGNHDVEKTSPPRVVRDYKMMSY